MPDLVPFLSLEDRMLVVEVPSSLGKMEKCLKMPLGKYQM